MAQPKMMKFGEGWSEEKLLAYWVRAGVIGIIGYAEPLQDSKLNEQDSKLVERILQTSKRGAEEIEKLFRIICDRETA